MLGFDDQSELAKGSAALREALAEFWFFHGPLSGDVVSIRERALRAGPLVDWRCKNCGAAGQCNLAGVRHHHSRLRTFRSCAWNTGAVVVRRVKGVE